MVLADEINRAAAKTQSALLEVMEERTVTVDGDAHPVPDPFLVVATQNPIDLDGTYRLPEAQLDRFLIRTSLGYPTPRTSRGAAPRRRRRRRRRRAAPSPTPRRCGAIGAAAPGARGRLAAALRPGDRRR